MSRMANPRVVALQNRLDGTFARAKRIDVQESELRSDFAKYLCVSTSGFVEYVLYELALAYCRPRSAPEVLNFVEAKLEMFQNPYSYKISDLLRSFDLTWGDEFEKLIEGETKEALNSIVSLRNKISHGESANVTFSTIERYYSQIKIIIKFLESKFDR